MTEQPGPAMARRSLRTHLRQFREDRQATMAEAAQHLDWSMSKINRIEGGQVSVSVSDLRALLSFYHITDPVLITTLVGWARLSRSRSWMHRYAGAVPPGVLEYVGFEAEADTIRVYNPTSVPELAQTSDYAWHQVSNSIPPRGPAQAGPVVALRMQRQQQLHPTRVPVGVALIIDEAVLYRGVGGRAIMHDQVAALHRHRQPNITLGVVPLDVDPHPGPNHGFTILDFGPADPGLVAFDTARGDIDLVDDPDLVGACRRRFTGLAATTLDEAATAALLTRILTDPA